ncbi:MAG: two-component regulator propeller domain-containing protein [Luteolibacter sp.]
MAVGRETTTRPEFLVRTWQSDEGLPGNLVRSVGQTPDGFLWIATAEGLARFDGLEFESIQATGEWRGRPLDFYRVFTPADGSVWVATYRYGLFRLGEEGLECVISDYEEQSAGIVTRLFSFGNETYVVRDQRLWKIRDHSAEIVRDVSAPLAHAMSADLALQRQRGRADDTRAPERLIDQLGGTWSMGAEGLEYTAADDANASKNSIAIHDSLDALDLLEDREGDLWVASPLRGLVRVRHGRVIRLSSKDGVYSEPTRVAIQSRDGSWWIARRSGGVDRIDHGELQHVPIVSSGVTRIVSSMLEDHAGRLWIASRDASVFVYNPQTRQVEARFGNTPELSKISVIAEDHEGRLWFGGRSKLFRWDGTTLQKFQDQPLLQDAEISTLAFDAKGMLYAGTLDGRILTCDGSVFSQLGDIGPLPRRSISTILPLSQDELWASSLGAGLLLWKDGVWHRFGSRQGIPDERLTALALTGNDSLWMGSLAGVLRASRTDLLKCIADDTYMPGWLHLDRSDGLVTRECVGWTQPGVFSDGMGSLWFPTTGGLVGVKTEPMETSHVAPILHLQTVEVQGVPQPNGSNQIVAGPGSVRLGFHFTGLSLGAPEKVTYRARLKGLEQEMRFIGINREIEYPLVPPGRYTFEVAATSGDGMTSDPEAVTIEVLPHFWQRPWVMVLIAMVSLLCPLLVGWLVARRRMRLKIHQLRMEGMLDAERARISRDLHDDLGASLTELSILSELAAEDHHRGRPASRPRPIGPQGQARGWGSR